MMFATPAITSTQPMMIVVTSGRVDQVPERDEPEDDQDDAERDEPAAADSRSPVGG